MVWKKLLENKELIAYEKSTKDSRVRIEARNKKAGWLIYKTYNFLEGEDWKSHVSEYITRSERETRALLLELKNEKDITLNDVTISSDFDVKLKRCYKEDFVEKWQFSVDEYTDENFLIVFYDAEIKIDIIMHDRYNKYEKAILDKLIEALGLKDISNKVRYDFFYFKKHSAKRRVYKQKDTHDVVAKVEFNIDPNFDPQF